MSAKTFRIGLVLLVLVGISVFISGISYAAEYKLGYVDLRRAFYEYEKAKTMESELSSLTDSRQTDRTRKIEAISKLRDESELLSGEIRSKKLTQVDLELVKLQEYDRETRQELLTKKNDMFKVIIEDIQKVVEDIGKKESYDYIFDSRNIMFSNDAYDLTDKVLKSLNK